MEGHVSRRFVYLIATYTSLVLAILIWAGCGGTNQNPTASNNPSPGSSQPGSTSSGSGGGTGSAGGSGGSGSSAGAGSGGAAYLYVSFASDTARIGGYKVDLTGASLAPVPGSPFSEQGGTTPGVLVVSKNLIFGSEEHISSTSSSSSSVVITGFRSDASSGSLTQVGTLTLPNNTQAPLVPEPTGHNLYVLDSFGNILTLTINPDGTLTNTGSSLHLADGVSSLAVSPNGQLVYAAISNGSFKAGTLTDALVVLNRDPNSGKLTFNRQVNSQQHLLELQFDTAGTYLLGISGASEHISVYSVEYSTGNASPVPGSPFASTRGTSVPNSSDFTRTFRLDPSGNFVYVLNANGADPKPEYVSVFAFAHSTGMLSPVQQFDMTPGTSPMDLAVDPLLIYVVSTNSGFNPSILNVFRRDANTGMLSTGGSPLTVSSALGQVGEVHF